MLEVQHSASDGLCRLLSRWLMWAAWLKLYWSAVLQPYRCRCTDLRHVFRSTFNMWAFALNTINTKWRLGLRLKPMVVLLYHWSPPDCWLSPVLRIHHVMKVSRNKLEWGDKFTPCWAHLLPKQKWQKSKKVHQNTHLYTSLSPYSSPSSKASKLPDSSLSSSFQEKQSKEKSVSVQKDRCQFWGFNPK